MDWAASQCHTHMVKRKPSFWAHASVGGHFVKTRKCRQLQALRRKIGENFRKQWVRFPGTSYVDDYLLIRSTVVSGVWEV